MRCRHYDVQYESLDVNLFLGCATRPKGRLNNKSSLFCPCITELILDLILYFHHKCSIRSEEGIIVLVFLFFYAAIATVSSVCYS